MTAATTTTSRAAASATLDSYVRHAERHGMEMVFELAAGLVWPFKPKLSDRQLGRLAVELRRIDPTWRLPKGENPLKVRDPVDGIMKSPGGFEVRPLAGADLALRLVAEGIPETAAARMAGISIRTLQRRQAPARKVLEQLGQDAKSRSEPALQSGVHATNPTPESERSSGAVLSAGGAQTALWEVGR